MPSFPFVSVIIPNYNHAEFLDQRIKSVLNQTYINFEVIVLDDNSTDESLDIINKYKELRRVKRVIVNPDNSGSVFKQWVKGINLAKGKYLWIAESDDYADEMFLEETVKLAEESEDIGLIFTDSYNVDQDAKVKDKVSERHALLSPIEQEFYVFQDKTKAPGYFIDNMLILNASSVLFNLNKFKETVDLVELESFKNTGDQFSYISLFLMHEIIYLNKPLNYRRIHENNTTAINFQNGIIYKERIRIINYFFPAISKFPSSKITFNSYLRQNFLKATDFRIVNEMEGLLRKFYAAGFIAFQKYLYLKFYIWALKISPKQPPYRLRSKIKKVLQNK